MAVQLVWDRSRSVLANTGINRINPSQILLITVVSRVNRQNAQGFLCRYA